MRYNIEEQNISDWADEELNRVVADWLGEVCDECWDEDCLYGPPGAMFTCECGASANGQLDYCNNDASAWRLLERMPRHPMFSTRPISKHGVKVVRSKENTDTVSVGDVGVQISGKGECSLFSKWASKLKRALAEAAATLAARGVDPREAPS